MSDAWELYVIEYARSRSQPVASLIAGAFVFSAGLGLVATNCVNAFSYGYDKLRFIKPVFIGDTIYTIKTDLEKTGALPSDTEDAINLLLQIAGTEVAVILVEQLTGGYKISFRSRCKVDCSVLASLFNGGGHKAAAGAFIEGPFEECQRRVLDAARAAMQ